ncbi:MAG: hypothetical protein D6693_02665 [Planctomycetota bacterium]|nr:MAG: hypothetical protein D6693_02665 [Planctomycetota bacterium]
MTAALAIARREFAAYFRTPLGWVVIALYLALSGVVFALAVLAPAAPASMRPFFGLSGWVLLFVAPAVSMRLISDEIRSGTIEPLMTAPVSDWAVMAGKLAAALAFLVALLAPTGVYVAVLERVSDPDLGPVLAGYLGLALAGALYLSVGAFFSTLTGSQTLAYLGALFTLLLVRLATGEGVAGRAPDAVADALYAVSLDRRLGAFAAGVVDTADASFFVVASAWLYVLSVIALQSRRWR